MATFLQNLFVRNKRKLQLNGFDLDLTYITPRIIAMSYPGDGFDSLIRNDAKDVVTYLDIMHGNNYKVYNLCAEKYYEPSKFHGRAAYYPFEDHGPPPFELIKIFCSDVTNWLSRSPDNVVAIHCKAGKGRTGVMICSFLIHSNFSKTASDAIDYYSGMRTIDSKAIERPSQERYILYYDKLLKHNLGYSNVPLLLWGAKLDAVQELIVPTRFTVEHRDQSKFSSADNSIIRQDGDSVLIDLIKPALIQGDSLFRFFDDRNVIKEKLFKFWINTFFAEDDDTAKPTSKISVNNSQSTPKVIGGANYQTSAQNTYGSSIYRTPEGTFNTGGDPKGMFYGSNYQVSGQNMYGLSRTSSQGQFNAGGPSRVSSVAVNNYNNNGNSWLNDFLPKSSTMTGGRNDSSQPGNVLTLTIPKRKLDWNVKNLRNYGLPEDFKVQLFLSKVPN